MPKSELEIPEELVDEIVEEILESKTLTKKSKTQKPKVVGSIATDSLLPRMEEIENKLEEYINSYKITATELERQITEKSEELTREQDKQLTYLQGQIENLREAMIRLSGEVKKLKDAIQK